MKRTVFAILAVFTILLTACTSPLTGILPGATQASNELTNTQLAVGTLKLEGTEQDISTEQARELLVLWYVYSDLSQSDIAAQEEVNGLIAQVQENMTAEQMQAITDMEISQQDISSAAQGSAKTSKLFKQHRLFSGRRRNVSARWWYDGRYGYACRYERYGINCQRQPANSTQRG